MLMNWSSGKERFDEMLLSKSRKKDKRSCRRSVGKKEVVSQVRLRKVCVEEIVREGRLVEEGRQIDRDERGRHAERRMRQVDEVGKDRNVR